VNGPSLVYGNGRAAAIYESRGGGLLAIVEQGNQRALCTAEDAGAPGSVLRA
jgi:hypothetical protein